MQKNVTVSNDDSLLLNNKHKVEYYYSLRAPKRIGNVIWHTISSITSSFAKWKLIWIRMPQKPLDYGIFKEEVINK